MAKKQNKPTKTCADCIHEFACRGWTGGRYISDASASRCPNHETVQESGAYLCGVLDERNRTLAAQNRAEQLMLHKGDKGLENFDMTAKPVMLGGTSSIQYVWHTKSGNFVAEFKIWDWWDGKNVSDLEIGEKYRGLGLSYELLDYATKRCGAKNLTVKKSNTIAKYVYDKYGFHVTDEDDEYYYMSLSKRITMEQEADNEY